MKAYLERLSKGKGSQSSPVLADPQLGSEQQARQGPEGQRAGEESANKDRAGSHKAGDHWEKRLVPSNI